jgi:hypothetical protein
MEGISPDNWTMKEKGERAACIDETIDCAIA